MEQSITLIFAKPINENYFEYGVNTLERMKYIERNDLRHFIANNISQDLISIRQIRELVEGYESFVIDNKNKEFWTLDLEITTKDITNTVKSKDLLANKKDNIIDKIKSRIEGYKLNITGSL